MLRSSHRILLLLIVLFATLCTVAALAQTAPAATQEYKVYFYKTTNDEPTRELLDGPAYEQRKGAEIAKWVTIYTEFLNGNYIGRINDPDHPFTAADAQLAVALPQGMAQRLTQDPAKLAEMAQSMGQWAYFYDQLDGWQTFVEKKVIQSPLAANEKVSFDPANIGKLDETYKLMQTKSKVTDDAEFKHYMKMVQAIDKDKTDQEAFESWLKMEAEGLQAFAEKWGRRYDGTEFEEGGTLYLVRNYKEVPPSTEDDTLKESLPRNAVLLETSHGRDVTPYDLLNSDGTLRKPVR